LILGNALGLDAESIAFLVSANFLSNGIAVLIQVIGIGKYIGGKLPLILGASFVPLAPMIVIAENYSISHMFGAVIGSSLIMLLLSFRLDKVLKLFPKVVVGSFVTLIGISLAPIAMTDFAGGSNSLDYGSLENMSIGFAVFLSVILTSKFGRGSMKSVSLLFGIVLGTIISGITGNLSIEETLKASWFQPISPFMFGKPEFSLGPIIIMTVFSVVNMIQCFGAFSVLETVIKEDVKDDTKVRAMRAQIVSQAIGGAFSSVPTTVFNENIGLINITKITDKSVMAVTGLMLVFIGMIPKFSSFAAMIPKPVIGGITLALFGIIISAGISILSTVDFEDGKNFTIVGTSIAVGVGASFSEGAFEKFPEVLSLLLGNGLFMASITAITLNIILKEAE
jgi:xanthine permease